MQNTLKKWLDKRIPAARRHRLGHKNTFIFPSRFGGLYLFLCTGLFVLGTNYQNNLMIILCYFLLSLFLLNLFLAHINFSNLDIQVGKINNTFVDDNLQLPIWFNHTSRPTHGIVSLGFWRSSEKVTVDLDNFSNPAFLPLICRKRGKLTLPRVTIESLYPLGLFRCWTHLAFDSQLIIYPKPIASQINLIELEDQQQQDDTTLRATQGHDDFDSLAPYKQGEPLYHVAWKQVAKGQGMISKHFSQHTGGSGYLRLAESHPQKLELSLSRLCYQVIELSRKNQYFGLILGNQTIAPDTGLEHEKRCLQALALYKPAMSEVN